MYPLLCQLLRSLVAVSVELGATAGPLGRPRCPGPQARAVVPASFQDMCVLVLLIDQK